MNENQLLSWQPRPPSAGLKRRLFGQAEREDATSARWLWSGLAPTMACVLLTLMMLNRGGVVLDAKVPMSLILSNQSNAAYASGGAGNEENHLAALTFDSTNRSDLGSSIRFTPSTNLTN